MAQPVMPRSEALFALEAGDVAGLSQSLGQLRAHAQQSNAADIDAVARAWWQAHPNDPGKKSGLALVAHRSKELFEQIEFAINWLNENPSRPLPPPPTLPPGEREETKGIFYTPNPVGRDGKLAFVFPGSGNHFPGTGGDLSAHWPEILRRQDAENGYLESQILPQFFWQRDSLDGLDNRSIILGQAALGTVISDLLVSFGLQPQAAIGYSLGESVALLAPAPGVIAMKCYVG